MARTGTPPREKARVYRTGRPDRLSPLLFGRKRLQYIG